MKERGSEKGISARVRTGKKEDADVKNPKDRIYWTDYVYTINLVVNNVIYNVNPYSSMTGQLLVVPFFIRMINLRLTDVIKPN